MINANSFPWVPSSLIFFDMERWYVNMNWINPSAKGFWFDPIFQAVDLDPKLKERKALGKKVLLTINQTPEWRLKRDNVPDLNDGHYTETKLGKWNKDGTLPASWTDDAQDFFKIAARYGRKSHSRESLGVDETERWGAKNVPLSGLDLVTHIEPGNENIAWWRPARTSLNPQEFAAYCSAVYDGHEGTIPNGGIKTADPTMVVVMPGLPNLDLATLKAMNEWFKTNRKDKKFAADVINVHHYSNAGNDPNNLTSQWTHGCSPEQDSVRSKLKGIVDYAKSLSTPLPVYWSEFGYNTLNVNTSQGIIPFAGKNTEQIQSEWLKRSYLEGLLAGVDKMFMFETLDEYGAWDGGMWETCGMVGAQYPKQGQTKEDQDSYKPKLSWYGLRDLYLAIKGGTDFKETNKDGVRQISFIKDGKLSYIYYLPTSTGAAKDISDYPLTASGMLTTLHLTEDPIVSMHNLFEQVPAIPPTPPTPGPKPPISKDKFEISIKSLKTGKITKVVVEV